jgi:hypothetical protein
MSAPFGHRHRAAVEKTCSVFQSLKDRQYFALHALGLQITLHTFFM